MTFVHVSRVAAQVLNKVADGFTDRASSENPASVPNRLPTMGERNLPKDRSEALPHGSEIDDGSGPLTVRMNALSSACLTWIDVGASNHFCTSGMGLWYAAAAVEPPERSGSGVIKKMEGLPKGRGPPSGPPHGLGDIRRVCAAGRNIR